MSDYFDANYYRSQFECVPFDDDGLKHFLSQGWRDGYDPSPKFETRYYLASNPDVAAANINPLIHFVQYGRKERRTGLSYRRKKALNFVPPRVSVILPSGRRPDILQAALTALEHQSYRNIEVIIVAESSFPGGRTAVESLVAQNGAQTRVVGEIATDAAGLTRWRSGIEHALGDVIWSIDADTPTLSGLVSDYLAGVVPAFADESVMAAVGEPNFSLAKHAQPIPANAWFRMCGPLRLAELGIGDIIFRRQSISPEVWPSEMENAATPVAENGVIRLLKDVANGGRISSQLHQRQANGETEKNIVGI